jgi:hypothetical protein
MRCFFISWLETTPPTSFVMFTADRIVKKQRNKSKINLQLQQATAMPASPLSLSSTWRWCVLSYRDEVLLFRVSDTILNINALMFALLCLHRNSELPRRITAISSATTLKDKHPASFVGKWQATRKPRQRNLHVTSRDIKHAILQKSVYTLSLLNFIQILSVDYFHSWWHAVSLYAGRSRVRFPIVSLT